MQDTSMPQVAWRWLVAIATARLVLHLLTNGQYGFHRDELAVLADARALDWGFVAYPPMTPFLAAVSMQVFGESLQAFRLPSALAQAAATLLAGLIARELGGGKRTQAVAALVLCCVPFSMLAGSMLQYTSPDYLWWVLCAWVVLKLCNGGDRRWWLVLGLAIGLGMLTRYTMVALVAGIVIGTLATPLRRDLTGPWPWAGAALSLLVFAPNAWWQFQHDFVYLDFVAAIHERDMRIGRTDGFLTGQLLVGAGPMLVPLWVAGLAWLARAKATARWRTLVWMYAVPLLVFLLAEARDYYLAPAYPMLLAAGTVAVGGWLHERRARTARIAVGAWLAAAFASSIVIALPVSPIGSVGWDASRAVHDNFAEQVGWPELVAEVAQVYNALPPGERRHTAVFANNYGEAGAIDYYGPALGLPRALSTINSFWARGPADPSVRTVIVLGDSTEGIADAPATCVRAGRVRIPHGVENEESARPDIFVCRDFRVPIETLWPRTPEFA